MPGTITQGFCGMGTGKWPHPTSLCLGSYWLRWERVSRATVSVHTFMNTALITDSFLQRKTTAYFPVRTHREDTTH